MEVLWAANRSPFHPFGGGAERIIREVSRRLARRGHSVTVLAASSNSEHTTRIIEGAKVVEFPTLVGLHLGLATYLARNKQTDVVVSDLAHVAPWPQTMLFPQRSVAYFHHLHARTLPSQVNPLVALPLLLSERLYPVIYRRGRFVVDANGARDDLCRLGVEARRISTIPPGVDLDVFRPGVKSAQPSLVYFGGLRRYKRPEHCIYLVKELERRGVPISASIIGAGAMSLPLENLARNLGVKNRVRFHRFVDDQRLAQLVGESWVNVQTSISEGWGMVTVEAAAAGVPTVGYDVPGLRDSVLSGSTGMLVQDGNLGALADAVEQIVRDPQSWWSRSAEHGREFDWDSVTEKWETVLATAAD